MRNVVRLTGGCVAISLLTLVAVMTFGYEATMVTAPGWVRGTIVTAASLLTLWHRLDQGMCGLLLLALAVAISRRPAARP